MKPIDCLKEKCKKLIESKFVKKTIRGAVIAGASAFMVVVLEGVMQMDFGAYTVGVYALASAGINAVNEYRKKVLEGNE